ncbi:MAG: helix-turn-helix domain-containing protein [Helicobacteraceae bacterium]|nr:helix-turn-helix domain-containing protein [Helicobacteraceae bacterium]
MKIHTLLRAAREKAGLTQAELAKKAGISQNSVWLYEGDRGNITIGNLEKLASVLNVPLSYFISSDTIRARESVTQALTPSVRATILSDGESAAQAVNVPRLKIKIAAGEGAVIDDATEFPTDGDLILDRALFKLAPPKELRAIEVDGYSMVPMLLPGAWIVFDANDNHFRQDGLYAINWHGELMVKLLQVDPKGVFHITSVNRDYKSWEIAPDDQRLLVIVGRVIKVVT